jgi:outer membrane protein OmpA-like peptidoglycan-associated protein
LTAADVQELSLRRANSVKQALLRKFPSLQPNQFTTAGRGWDRPADANDPNNNAKNRRVELAQPSDEVTAILGTELKHQGDGWQSQTV